MFNHDRMVRIGEIPDLDFSTDVPRRTPLAVRRDGDLMILPAAQLDLAGLRDLEKVIAVQRNAVARYRLREVDFDALGVDLDEARDDLADIPNREGECEPRNLELADWVEITARLEAMHRSNFYGYNELRKLSALLMADEVPATEAAS